MKKRFLLGIPAIMLILGMAVVGCSGGRTFDAEKVEGWLAKQKGGASPDNPIPFRVKLNLQNMASPESNWHKLLTSINTAGLYVALDLSGSAMPGTEFNADGGTQTGKSFIVSLVLPDSTERVAGDIYRQFRSLKTVRKRDSKYIIGDTGPAGGIIFYDKWNSSDGWRYLEAAPADMDTRLHWVEGSFPDIAGTETAIGTGRQNTTLILSVDANAPAAKACADYRGGGFSDWFLPSRDELDLMYGNLKVKDIGGFENNSYWSSSQNYSNYSWVQGFSDGSRNSYRKDSTHSVRSVRAF